MNRICIAALMTVMICSSGCEPTWSYMYGGRAKLPKDSIEATNLLSAAISPLHEIRGFSGSRVDYIRMLIREGADVNAENRNLMMSVARTYSPEIAEIATLLIEEGADINAEDEHGITPLKRAVSESTPELVAVLIEAGADVNAPGGDDLWFWVFGGQSYYIRMGDALRGFEMGEILTLVIEAGADVNAKDERGVTAMMRAASASASASAFYGIPELVTQLIEAGADVNAKDERGVTALMIAAAPFSYGTPEIVTLLIEAGADVNAKMLDGTTSLDAARANPEINRILRRARKAAGAKE